MSDHDFQKDFFGEPIGHKTQKKPRIFPKYPEQRFLPFIKIPMEYSIIIIVIFLVMLVVAYAAGVERGRRLSTEILPEVDLSTQEIEVDTNRTFEPVLINESLNEPEVLEEELLLETKVEEQVEVTAEEEEPVISGPMYNVQLASFRNSEYAEDVVAELKAQGYKADYSRKGEWYQVYVTGYTSKDAASQAMWDFSEEFEDCYIKKVN